jgi:hypothetical protein
MIHPSFSVVVEENRVSWRNSWVGLRPVGRPETLLRCVQCDHASDQLAMGWRAYLTDEEAEESRVLMFCPGALSASSARAGRIAASRRRARPRKEAKSEG